MNPIDDIHDQRNMPKRYNPQKHLDPKLRRRLTLYYFIALVLVVIAIFHIIRDHVSTLYPLLSLAIGIGLGALASRMFHITWDHGARQAISRFDTYGIVILVFYIAFEAFRNDIIGYFIHGPSVVATSFALFAGTMIGRLIGMRGRIREVVAENL
jgi:hypothetical protein